MPSYILRHALAKHSRRDDTNKMVIPTNVQRTSELRPLFHHNTLQNRSTCSAGLDYFVQYTLDCPLLKRNDLKHFSYAC